MLRTDKIWLIAYINRKLISSVEEELKSYESLKDIEIYIPTIKLVKKKSKKTDIFEIVPLLFNYGFIKMKYEDAINPDFLMLLRSKISCIYAWVKDPANNFNNKPRLKKENEDIIDGPYPRYAIATDKEIERMIIAQKSMSIYNADDINKIEEGTYIRLKGYPFDNIPAKIVKIDEKKRQVKVELEIETLFKEVFVSFENVFYTIYSNYDLKPKEKSIEEMGDLNMIDALTFKANYDEK